MKVGALKPVRVGKKLVFNVVKPLEEKSLFQLENIFEDLIRLNIERSAIRRSRNSTKESVSKKFW